MNPPKNKTERFSKLASVALQEGAQASGLRPSTVFIGNAPDVSFPPTKQMAEETNGICQEEGTLFTKFH
jgi:hypothetical protein